MISWRSEVSTRFFMIFPEIYQQCSTAKVVAEKVSQGRTVVVREARSSAGRWWKVTWGGRKDGVDQAAYDYFMIIYIYIYIRNYSYLEYAGIQSCPLIGKKRYIEYVLFLEDFRRSILDPIPKNSAPPKTLGSHHGSPWFFPLQSQT